MTNVDQADFFRRLLTILGDISAAEFIAIDLEMSGIRIENFSSQNQSNGRKGKTSLEDTYLEAKAAAERYQVLQLGLTCVMRNDQRGCYIAKPYNFNVNPLFRAKEQLKLHRDITLSSSAIRFLLDQQSVDLGTVLSHGVSFLSHKEEEEARRIAIAALSTSTSLPDIIVAPSDVEALEIVRRARKELRAWTRDESTDKETFLNIDGPLNAFQRRLIHQLVRKEFPEYQAKSRDSYWMQVMKLDTSNEERFRMRKLANLERLIMEQKGLTYIFEALTGGGSIANIDPELLVSYSAEDMSTEGALDLPPSLTFPITRQAAKDAIGKHASVLARKQHFLVGHNLFTDLVFLTQLFIGHLPETLSEYKNLVRALFPCVIDTKYMATQEGGAGRGGSSLDSLMAHFATQSRPLVQLDQKHAAYAENGKMHEAGYDSWTTAQLFLKLAGKLQSQVVSASDSDTDSESSTYYTGDEGVPINPPDTNFAIGGLPLNGHGRSQKSSQADKATPQYFSKPSTSRFAMSNKFAMLDQLGPSPTEQDGGALLDPSSPVRHARCESAVSNSSIMDDVICDDMSQYTPTGQADPWLASSAELKTAGSGRPAKWHNGGSEFDVNGKENGAGETFIKQWVPAKESAFWKRYMNKLRVYSAEGEICDFDTD